MSGPPCWSAGHPARRSPSRASGWSGSEPAWTLTPAFFRRTPGSWPRRGRGLHPGERLRPDLQEQGQSTPAFERLLREIDGAGYGCRWAVLNAADFGVPQLRPRLFIVGAPKKRAMPELPEPTSRRQLGAPLDRRRGPAPRHDRPGPSGSRRQTRSRRRSSAGGGGTSCRAIPPGENYLHYTAERGHPDPIFEWRSRYWSLPPQARPRAAFSDDPGPAGPERRAVPLGESAAPSPRAAAPVHLPGRLRIRRFPGLGPGPDRELRAPASRATGRRARS